MFKALLISLLLFSQYSYGSARSISEPKVKWSKSSVAVCWGDLESFDNENSRMRNAVQKDDLVNPNNNLRKKIESFINSEFTQERTGIHFIGWKFCSESKEIDARIYIAFPQLLKQLSIIIPESDTMFPQGKSSIGEAGIFESLDGFSGFFSKSKQDKSSLILNVYSDGDPNLLNVNAMTFLKILSLHEFGHLAALRHEHIRPEAKEDPDCRTGSEQPSITSKFTSDYDPDSIMNYCYIDRIMEKGVKEEDVGLSKEDVHALECLYKNLECVDTWKEQYINDNIINKDIKKIPSIPFKPILVSLPKITI